MLSDRGQPNEAEEAYRRGLSYTPDDAPAHYNLAMLFLEQNRLTEAEQSLCRVIALQPKDGEANFLLGNVLAGLGQPEQALECYRNAARIKPDFVEAINNIGAMLRIAGRLEEAE